MPEERRRGWNDAKIDSRRYSCSTFMLYLGIEGEIVHTPGHSDDSVSLLREIISDQEELNRRTKELQKERLRDLFEE